MSEIWIDHAATVAKLESFFQTRSKRLYRFGTTVNQVFEAFVFTEVLVWYRTRQWHVELVHPDKTRQALVDGPNGRQLGNSLRLKFSTRGAPDNYSYARCTKEDQQIQVRHQLRADTAHYRRGKKQALGTKKKARTEVWANICLDVAVIKDADLSKFKTDWSISSPELLTFGEAKHMSAYAELVAGFIGLVHEMQPQRLKRVRVKNRSQGDHPAPFMYVSGLLYRTAEGIVRTIERRKFDVDVYTRVDGLTKTFELPTKPAPAKAAAPAKTKRQGAGDSASTEPKPKIPRKKRRRAEVDEDDIPF